MLSRFLFGVGALAAAACAASSPGAVESAPAARAPELERVAENVWVHKSWHEIAPWGLVLSQGLVIETPAGVFLVDTAWTNADTALLVDDIEQTLGTLPKTAIVTHAHDDKMGGMAALKAAGVATFAHPLTNADAPTRGLAPADADILAQGDIAWFGGVNPHSEESAGAAHVVAYYPGPGHTRDNIVVYIPSAKLLFGGCLIRPAGATNLGNTADADIAGWAAAVRRVAEKFPEAEIVIPSHGPVGDRALLDHTIALAEAANAGE